MFSARTIIESHVAEKTITEAINAYPRLEDAWEGWKWRLARDPERDATMLEGPPKRLVIKTPVFPSVPPITIHYHFDEKEVTIISIRIGRYII